MTKNQSTYITFYRVMLILSTIGTAFATLGLIALPQTINEFSVAPAYGVLQLLMATSVLVSIVALVLLWKKRVEGIRLKIGVYIAVIIFTIASFFVIEPYNAFVVQQTIAEAGPSAASGTEEAVRLFIPIISYLALVLGIIVDVVFALLWRSAWKKQKEEDSEA